MGFTTVNIIKTVTLCNEYSYGTEKKKTTKTKKKYNMKIMLYNGVADSISSF